MQSSPRIRIRSRVACEPVKARCVINQQFSLALLAEIFSLQEDIDRAIEAVSMRQFRAVNPTLIAEVFDGERQFLNQDTGSLHEAGAD